MFHDRLATSTSSLFIRVLLAADTWLTDHVVKSLLAPRIVRPFNERHMSPYSHLSAQTLLLYNLDNLICISRPIIP